MDTLPLPLKGCKVRPLLGPHGQCSDGSLPYDSYCDTDHPFIIIISEDPWHSHLFLRLRSVAAGIQTPTFRLRGELSNPLRHRRCMFIWVNVGDYLCVHIHGSDFYICNLNCYSSISQSDNNSIEIKYWQTIRLFWVFCDIYTTNKWIYTNRYI